MIRFSDGFLSCQCFENMAHAVATKKGLSIEYDETTTCDVCLSVSSFVLPSLSICVNFYTLRSQK